MEYLSVVITAIENTLLEIAVVAEERGHAVNTLNVYRKRVTQARYTLSAEEIVKYRKLFEEEITWKGRFSVTVQELPTALLSWVKSFGGSNTTPILCSNACFNALLAQEHWPFTRRYVAKIPNPNVYLELFNQAREQIEEERKC